MKKICSTAIAIIMILMAFTTIASAEDFSDCKKGDWYYESVQYAKEKGWVNGFEDGTFKPNDTLTKAQAVVIVTRAAGIEVPSVAGEWYEGAVQIAKEKGLIYTNIFLDRPIAREEVFYMIHGGYNFSAIDRMVENERVPFTDYNFNAYSKVIPTFYSFGLLNGYKEGGELKVKPKDNLTRAEMCTILKSVEEFDFEKWIAERDLFSDEIVKRHLIEMIEAGESKTTAMYAHGKTDREISARVKQIGRMCFDLYEHKYPSYFKNYSYGCGSYIDYGEGNFKVYIEMEK